MNFLAHIYLSGDDEDIIIGNFIADGIKGKKYLRYPSGIAKGILLHREIDTFTDAHPTVRLSTAKLHENHGHYGGVIVDVLYDHFLAKNWKDYHPKPLKNFVRDFYELIQNNFDILPPRIKNMLPYMISQNWLESYATIEGIDKILNQMSRRVHPSGHLDTAVVELREYYSEFESEFTSFFKELIEFSKQKLLEL